VRGQRYYRVQNRYPEIAQPALLLWGREDRVTPLSVGERLVRDLPNARLVVYPRCGHFPMIEASRASSADLTAFLSGRGG
jgi:pimeloyl-ACP methyl ester carboxylesterase